MNREIIPNYFIGRYGEDLIISPKKYSRDYYKFRSFVLNDFKSVEISKEDREIIIKLYCEYGHQEDIKRDDLKALKWRANNLSTLLTFAVSEYLKTKKESQLEEAKQILVDVDVLNLNEEQYEKWFVLDINKSLIDEKKIRDKLIEEHKKLNQNKK